MSSNSYPQGCQCGWYGDPVKECTCSATAIARYQKRISGPLLDRIDIHVEVPRVEYEKLAEKRAVEDSTTVRKRVQAARERQLQRFKGTKLTCKAEMGPSEVRSFCGVEPSAEKLLKAAMQQLHVSARAFHRVLKLARTIADLAGCDWGQSCGGGDSVSASGGDVAVKGCSVQGLETLASLLLEVFLRSSSSSFPGENRDTSVAEDLLWLR